MQQSNKATKPPLDRSRIMKKNTIAFLLILISFFFFISCNKEDNFDSNNTNAKNLVTQETALNIAQHFTAKNVSANSKTKGNTKISKSVKEIFEQKTNKNNAAFYIINYAPEGFVIVSADNRINPILAYSDTGSFSSDLTKIIPPVKFWMEEVKEKAQYAIDKDITQSKQINLEWKALSNDINTITTSKTSKIAPDPINCNDITYIKGPLLTTIWGQGDGYNNLLVQNCSYSRYFGTKAATGCVATAMAQIMKYHQNPVSYNWANMPDNGQFNSGNYDTQSLMAAAGASVTMHYGCGESSASTQDVPNALKNTFGYSAANYASFNSDTVVQNLESNKPVIVSGGTNYNGAYILGHAWVCDGYMKLTVFITDSNGNCTGESVTTTPTFHMNWGWDGENMGYFSLGNFNPPGNSFNYLNHMVYNITF
jgi:hypothetical protein